MSTDADLRHAIEESDLCTKHEAAKILKTTTYTIKRWRSQGKLTENIHYVVRSPRSILYIRPLIEDLAINWNNPDGHQRAIENYHAKLLSNQKRKR